ncbi:MAG: serine hydrolase [Planctomycetota bacterium]|nr:serine hydrolase [Planctomycetota bacterium]
MPPTRLLSVFCATALAAFACAISTDGPQQALPAGPEQRDPGIEAALAEVFEGAPVPGAVGGIAWAEGGTQVGAWGLRKAGSDAPMTPGDPVHVGSDTKAMTAVLAARQVDAGFLRWDSTLEEVLPSLAPRVHEGYRRATLIQFLHHTSGAPANAVDWRGFAPLPLRERRLQIAAASLQESPAAAPGTGFLYSNLGYMVAGAMIEAVRDLTWEELMVMDVFDPLGIKGAGFGAPGSPGEVDAPWGHTIHRAEPRPVQVDNDPALGPAGTVHLPVAGWARFALVFTEAAAKEEDAAPPFLSPASRQRLLEVGLEGYACGWLVTERSWAEGTALTHSGSNTTWFATVWIAPRTGRAYLVAANAAGPGVPAMVDRAIGALIALDQ